MIIFYPSSTGTSATGYDIASPVVVLDALDSSDRFTDAEVLLCTYQNDPGTGAIMTPAIYSCNYDFEFSHNSIPLGEGIKTQFIGSISSPPSALVAQFSPKFFTSAQSIDEMANVASLIANSQTTITHAALVVRDQNGGYVARSFIAYSGQIFPDGYGATTTMVIHGAAIEDTLINSEIGFVLKKSLPLAPQLTTMLTAAGYTAIWKTVPGNPVSDNLFSPMKLNELLDEVCLQNKLVPVIEGKLVTFYSQSTAPVMIASKASFSFLGSTGSLAWGIGVENYANIKFKTPYFDCKLFQPITIYNDIRSAFFSGLVKTANVSLYDSYDANIIRYSLIRNDNEIVTDITATNNWLLSQMRIDGILSAKVYSGAL